MALVLADRVQQTGTANTTVSFTLSGSVTGFQSFAVIGNTNTTYYGATDASGNWEVGLGTYSTTGPTLTRTTILSSSNSGSAVTFSGTVNVFVTYPSERSVYSNGTNIVPDNAATLLATSGGTGLSSFTANGILYASSTSALATGSALSFDGTNFTTTGNATAKAFIPSNSTVPTNGLYLPASNTIGFSTNTTEYLRITSDGRLQINGANSLTTTLVAVANTFPLNNAATAYQFRADATMGTANTGAVGFGSTYQLPATGAFSSSYQFYAGGLTTSGATLTSNYGLYVANQVATSTNVYGVYVAQQTSASTNTYGIFSNIDSGTNKYNFYADGTAANYIAGGLQIGGTASSSNTSGLTLGTANMPIPDGSAPLYACRAWVNFDATASGTFAGGTSTVSRTAGSTTATVTTTTAHGLLTGSTVNALTGVAAGAYTVTYISATQFSFTTVATTALTNASITFAVNSITASGNVSSIADIAVGRFGVNFTTAMPDANFVMAGTAGNTTGVTTSPRAINRDGIWTVATALIRVLASTSTNDDPYVGLAFFR